MESKEEILKGEKPSLLVSKKKVRFDALSEEVKREVYDFWTTQASRPTGDKNDFVRYHTQKMQSIYWKSPREEAFLEFQALHPDMKI